MRIRDSASGKSWFSKRRKRYDDNRDPRELTFSCGGGYDRNVTQERTLSKSPPLRNGGQGGVAQHTRDRLGVVECPVVCGHPARAVRHRCDTADDLRFVKQQNADVQPRQERRESLETLATPFLRSSVRACHPTDASLLHHARLSLTTLVWPSPHARRPTPQFQSRSPYKALRTCHPSRLSRSANTGRLSLRFLYRVDSATIQ